MAVRRKYALTGHVFERRFGEIICSSQEYLATLLNYIHNNPVKAQLCSAPGDWRWSSFAAYHGSNCELLPFVEPFDSIPIGVNTTSVNDLAEQNWRSSPMLDLRDLFQITLRKLTSGDVDLETLMAMRGRSASKLRGELIATAARAGYRGVQIARSLNVSESTVSKIAIENRLPRPRLIAG